MTCVLVPLKLWFRSHVNILIVTPMLKTFSAHLITLRHQNKIYNNPKSKFATKSYWIFISTTVLLCCCVKFSCSWIRPGYCQILFLTFYFCPAVYAVHKHYRALRVRAKCGRTWCPRVICLTLKGSLVCVLFALSNAAADHLPSG